MPMPPCSWIACSPDKLRRSGRSAPWPPRSPAPLDSVLVRRHHGREHRHAARLLQRTSISTERCCSTWNCRSAGRTAGGSSGTPASSRASPAWCRQPRRTSAAIASSTTCSIAGSFAGRADHIRRRPHAHRKHDLRGAQPILGRIAATGTRRGPDRPGTGQCRPLAGRRRPALSPAVGAVAMQHQALAPSSTSRAVASRRRGNVGDVIARLPFDMRERQVQLAAVQSAASGLRALVAAGRAAQISPARTTVANTAPAPDRGRMPPSRSSSRPGHRRSRQSLLERQPEQAEFGILLPRSPAPAVRLLADISCAARTGIGRRSADRRCP